MIARDLSILLVFDVDMEVVHPAWQILICTYLVHAIHKIIFFSFQAQKGTSPYIGLLMIIILLAKASHHVESTTY